MLRAGRHAVVQPVRISEPLLAGRPGRPSLSESIHTGVARREPVWAGPGLNGTGRSRESTRVRDVCLWAAVFMQGGGREGLVVDERGELDASADEVPAGPARTWATGVKGCLFGD